MEKFGTARQGRDENIIGRMRIAGWVNKATNTYSEYVMLLVHRNCVRERAPVLRLYVRCLSCQIPKSLPCSQEPSTKTYSKPHVSPHLHVLFAEDPS